MKEKLKKLTKDQLVQLLDQLITQHEGYAQSVKDENSFLTTNKYWYMFDGAMKATKERIDTLIKIK